MEVTLFLDEFILVLLIPFIFMVLFNLLLRLFNVHQWRRIHLTAQWSAIVYIAGVILVVWELYDKFILSYILIACLLFLAIHVTVQWHKETTISLLQAIVLLLRIVFLLFFIAYIVLVTIYGIRIFA